MTSRPRLIVALVLLAWTVPAPAADWTLTTADFKTEPADLVAVEADGVRVKGADGKERLVPNDQFLQVERNNAATTSPAGAGGAGAFMLHLLGGDRVGGEPVRVQGDQLVWKNPSVGELSVPLSRLVAMTKPGKPATESSRNEDVVTLSNGDAVRGIITTIAGGTVSVKNAAGDVVPVPVASVESVQFAATPGAAGAATAAAAKGYRVRLDDGSSVIAESLKSANATGDTVLLALSKDAVRPLPLARIASIELVNGPAMFLSSLPPAENVYTPFFGNAGEDYPARMNQTVDGSSDLRFGGKTFRKAIGVHSYSRLSWPLDGTYAAFRTQYAIDPTRTGADVTVRILLDGKPVHEQKNIRAGHLSPVVTVDVPPAAKQLTLEVDYGENLHVNDHLTWLEPALLKKKPQ
jgi:hypothetical protein